VQKDLQEARENPSGSKVNWISCDTRRNAEIHGDALREVGDVHSSDDGKDNITLPEQRDISLEVLCLNGRPG